MEAEEGGEGGGEEGGGGSGGVNNSEGNVQEEKKRPGRRGGQWLELELPMKCSRETAHLNMYNKYLFMDCGNT